MAGKRNVTDPRNALLISAVKIAVELKPRAFVLENVPGANLGSHHKYWHQVENILRATGYTTKTLVCRADSLGLAQIRTRLILVAVKKNHSVELQLPSYPKRALHEVLQGVEEKPNHHPEFLEKGSEQYLIAKAIRNNQKLCNVRGGPRSVHTWQIPEVFGKVTIREKNVLEALMVLRRRRFPEPCVC
jgi:DNA (cytosine-5)-methyltransferase 1